MDNINKGHGHVTKRPDGVKARCGGPRFCKVCQDEKAALERAVSPPESVQSVDGTRFRTLLWEFQRDAMSVARINLLIEHIDASRASAQAEGRRSAMEELAEVREASAYLAADAKDHSSRVQILLDRIAELEAARQAPDLSREEIIALIVRDVAELDYDGSEIDKMEVTPIDLTAILDSRLAQPLQQEGGKEAPADGLLRELTKASVGSCNCGAKTPDHRLHDYGCRYRAIEAAAIALSQQSDNLQQASTAQAESAKPNADCSGDPANCPDNEGYGCACDPLNKAATATDAVEEHPLEIYADSYERMSAQGCTAVHPISVATDIRNNMMPITIANTPAQATPEGAELIELAKQAGLWVQRHGVWMAIGGEAELCRFAELCRAAPPQKPDYSANSDHRIMQVDDNGMPM